ncbi:MAG: indolepyruvate oxidoreductase subunit beta [Rikenellaceae bacterium]|jgi:indolepyruvate ferredoxin oxidoreductase beta subunit|nr:indolepyruvate oxidoreductase subunit beta [Rikenellaceae bacterium]
MKLDIILAGVGGQGILTIATVIGEAALAEGLDIKQAEVHGMSQRGGDVHSGLRISDGTIWSDLIGRGMADAVISLDPMEALRYLPWLKPDGWIAANSAPFKNIPNYPDEQALLDELRRRHGTVMVDADAVAREAGASRSSNIALLGAASVRLGLPYGQLEEGVRRVFAHKGAAVVEANLRAMNAGKNGAHI